MILRDSLSQLLTALAQRAGDLAYRGERTVVEGAAPEHHQPQEEGRSFTKKETRLLAALAALLIPSGDGAPGAGDAGVIETVERLLSADPLRRARYARGLQGFDLLARRRHGRRFVEILPPQQSVLLTAVDEEAKRAAQPPVGLGGRLRRKLRHLRYSFDGHGIGAAVALFEPLVRDVVAAFYTSEAAWQWLGYDGPPFAGAPPAPPTEPAKPSPSLGAPSIHLKKEVADVVIVGCGAGGGVAAKVLAEAGLTVVVLDAGPRFNPATDYHTHLREFELLGDVFSPDDERRDRYTLGSRQPFTYTRVKGIGGSTLAYHGITPRFHETDFRAHSEDGVADDWPITYEDLEPYYTAVEYELGVSGPSGLEANPFDPPRSFNYPTAAHSLYPAAETIKRGADKLGLHLVVPPLALPTRRWGGRPECAGAGACHFGCRIIAKSSIDVTFVPKAEATGHVTICPEAVAREITLGPDGRARSVVYLDSAGREHEVFGRVIVVAGNAVETPRLLLMSRSNRFPSGLANSSGLVGKRFTEHLAVFGYAVFPDRVAAWRGVPVSGIIQDFYATDSRNSFARGFAIVVESSGLWPLSVARRIGGWGAAHKASVRSQFGHLVGLATVGEQLPDPRNAVTLDPALKDHLGLAVPRLLNEPRENDLAMISSMKGRLRELFEAGGAAEILTIDHAPGSSAHYLGTCRMGVDPRTSVVNQWCRTHDVPNLYIADGSVFVTGAAVNPALTISVLAMRTAEGIATRFARHEL